MKMCSAVKKEGETLKHLFDRLNVKLDIRSSKEKTKKKKENIL
jgi:hypothetical protein